MAVVVVGPPRKKSPQDALMESEWARALLNSKNFELLTTDAADRMVRSWSLSATPLEREHYFFMLQGLQALIRELQIMVGQGLSAVSGDTQDSKPTP